MNIHFIPKKNDFYEHTFASEWKQWYKWRFFPIFKVLKSKFFFKERKVRLLYFFGRIPRIPPTRCRCSCYFLPDPS